MKLIQSTRSAIALALVTLLLAAGCAGAPPTTQPTATQTTPPTTTAAASPTPTKPATGGPAGKYIIALSSFGTEVFDPTKAEMTTVLGIQTPLYDFMVRLDSKGSLAPGVLDKWEIAADGRSWTYTVHKGIKFHNGEDLTADDVKFSLERYIAKDAIYAELRDIVERIEKVDDYTVRVYTKDLQVYLPYLSSFWTPGQGQVQPKDYIEQNGMEKFERQPVGSGPYRLARRVPGDMVEFEALDSHWRKVPAFKKLDIVLMPEETTRVASLRTQSVDVIDVSLEATGDLNEADGYKIITADVTTPMVNLHGTQYPSAAGLPTADIRVRKALSLAVNREEIMKNFFFGKSNPPPPSYITPYAKDMDVAKWTQWAADYYKYDPEEAKRLLKEAGFANGFTIKLYSSAIRGAPFLPKLAEIVAGYWTKIGVNPQIIPMDWGAFGRIRAAPAPELIGNASMFRYTSNPIATTALLSGYSNTGIFRLFSTSPKDTAKPDLDKLLAQVNTEPDSTKRGEILGKIMEMTTPEYISFMLCTAPSLFALGPRVALDLNTIPMPIKGFGMVMDMVKPDK